jgi:parallel beta-helix repeat protein
LFATLIPAHGASAAAKACNDGMDNDGDGLIDYPADPGCISKVDNDEFNAPPPAGSCTTPNVAVNATMNTAAIQTLINASGNETAQFCFASGTYHLTAYLVPKTSQDFICDVRRTCILTGDDTYIGVFKRSGGTLSANRLTIQGFIIEHFANPFVDAANRCTIAPGWSVDMVDLEVRYNSAVGICPSTDTTVRDSFIHHNGVMGTDQGVSNNGTGTTTIYNNNEVSFNNTSGTEINTNAGGIVIKGSAGAYNTTITNNQVHDNIGNGIWADGLTSNALIENNTVYNNWNNGILYEISAFGTIHLNTVYNNELTTASQSASCYNANIQIAESWNTEVYGNTVTAANGENGICISTGTRDNPTNDSVHDNTVYMARITGQTSGPFTGATNCCIASYNTTFEANHYHVDDVLGIRWQWLNPPYTYTWSQWTGTGNDSPVGTVETWVP